MNLTKEIVDLAFTATEPQKAAAARILRGEVAFDGTADSLLEPYLSLSDTARQLRVSPCTLWRWQIPGHDFGGRRRFLMSEVRAYMASEDFVRRRMAVRAQRKIQFLAKAAGRQPKPQSANP